MFWISSINADSIYSPTVTGPVARFARQIASQGYICVAPSIYHDFEGPEPVRFKSPQIPNLWPRRRQPLLTASQLAYDGPGTDKGNDYKIQKTVASYDEDNKLTVDYLTSLKTCTGRIGATGMCLGGHLAYRAALDKRVIAATCFFATGTFIHALSEYHLTKLRNRYPLAQSRPQQSGRFPRTLCRDQGRARPHFWQVGSPCSTRWKGFD